MTELMNYKGVCRTAPATLGQLTRGGGQKVITLEQPKRVVIFGLFGTVGIVGIPFVHQLKKPINRHSVGSPVQINLALLFVLSRLEWAPCPFFPLE